MNYELEEFIKSYVPLGWKEPIGTVITFFPFSSELIEELERISKLSYKKAYDELDKLGGARSTLLENWVVKEAIMVFFVRDKRFRR